MNIKVTASTESEKWSNTIKALGLVVLDKIFWKCFPYIKKVSEYDQEIPQSQTADNPVAPRGRVAQPSRDTRRQISKAISSLFPIEKIAILEWT